MRNLDDPNFLNLLRAFDNEAYRVLVDQTKHLVVNTAFRFVLNKDTAEDIAQEVYVEVYHSISDFKGRSKLTTWIYQITVKRSIDKLREQKRQKRRSSTGKDLSIDAGLPIADSQNVHRNLEVKEQLEIIHSFLNQLPEKQRIAFTLSKIQGFNNTEIAEIMNVTKVAVESLIYRSRKAVVEHLRKFYDEDDRNTTKKRPIK